MTYAANYLVTDSRGIGYGGYAPGEFATIAEAIQAGIDEQDRSGLEPNWIMVEDEDRNVVADCTKEQIEAIRQGYQNPVDLARFHVEGPDFYKTAR